MRPEIDSKKEAKSQADERLQHLIQHDAWLRALARTLVSDPNLAEDVVQQTWVYVLKKLPCGIRNPRGWLAVATANIAKNFGRERARRSHRERKAARAEETPSTLQRFEQRSFQRSVAEILLALPDPSRSVLYLTFYEQLPQAEIARRLKISVRSVKYRLKAGLDQMRTLLRSRYGRKEYWVVLLRPWLDRTIQKSDLSSKFKLRPHWFPAAVGLFFVSGVALSLFLSVRPAASSETAGAFSLAQAEKEILPKIAPSSRISVRDLARNQTDPIIDSRAQRSAEIPIRCLDTSGNPLSLEIGIFSRSLADRLRTSRKTDLLDAPWLDLGDEVPHRILTDADGSALLPHHLPNRIAWSLDAAWTLLCTGWRTEEPAKSTAFLIAAPAASLMGRCLDSRGSGISGASVKVITLEKFFPILEASRSLLPPGCETESQSDGSFQLSGVPRTENTYLIVQWRGNRQFFPITHWSSSQELVLGKGKTQGYVDPNPKDPKPHSTWDTRQVTGSIESFLADQDESRKIRASLENPHPLQVAEDKKFFASVFPDRLGRFGLEIPSNTTVFLLISSTETPDRLVEIPPDIQDVELGILTTEPRIRLQVDLGNTQSARFFEIQDERGNALALESTQGLLETPTIRMPLIAGSSAPFETSPSARQLVLLDRGGRILEKIPIYSSGGSAPLFIP